MAIHYQVDWLFDADQQTTEELDIDLVVDVLVGQHETHLAAGTQISSPGDFFGMLVFLDFQ